MADKNGKGNGGRKASEASRSVMGNLPSTRPARMGRRREAAPAAPAPEKPKAAATAKPKAAATAKPKAAAAKKPKPRASAGPRAVRTGSPSLKRPTPEPARPEPSSGPPKGTELVTTAVQAAGELAQIGLTVGGQALKRAVRRLPKP